MFADKFLAPDHKRSRAFAGAVACVAMTSAALAQTAPGTAAPGDPFEIHGLLYSGSAPINFALGDAWAQGGAMVGVLDADGEPTLDPQTGLLFRAQRQVDQNWGNQGHGFDPTLFAGGNKNFDLIGPDQTPWEWNGGGGGPQKNDITNTYLHTRVDSATGDRWVFVGAETRSINGDSYVDFEFNQAGVVMIGETEGKLVGLGPDGGRTINDFIISIEFINGGETPVASVRLWNGASYDLLQIADAAYSATNFENIPHGMDGDWKHFASDGAMVEVLTHLQLVEGGVNIDALGIDLDVCAPEATFLVKTRSSSSFTSDLKDFALVHFPIEPPPVAEASAPELVCPGSTFRVAAAETTGLANARFSWDISGCGTIVSDPNSDVIMVEAGAGCDCDINLTVAVTGGECQNVVTAEASVTVRDDALPTLSGVPADATVSCDAVPEPPAVIGRDGCSPAVVELTETSEPGSCASERLLTRTWTATDDCGNQSSQSQVLTVVDTVAPSLEGVPQGVTVECDALPEPAMVTATDNCSGAFVEMAESTEPSACEGQYTLTRTWTATDECGNQSSQSQVISVVDTTAPELGGVPADTTVECDAIPDAALVTATDNCSEPIVEMDEQTEPGPGVGQAVITRTWTATDACGNQTSQTQVITVVDTMAPVLFDVPADLTVECDQVPDPPLVSADDNCADPTVDMSEAFEPGACNGERIIRRTWTATDGAGNQTSQTQTITVVDTTAPLLSGVPADMTVECDAIPEPALVTATDNCSEPAVEFAELAEAGPCSGQSTITRTWTATDDCGNQLSQSQVLTVVDTTAPVLVGVPAETTVECDAVPAPANVTATDNCSTPAVQMNETIDPGACVGQYTITRTWMATDECGNQSSESRVIHVQDTTAPVLSDHPADIVVECDAVPEARTLTASDNCDPDVPVEFAEETIPGDCPSNYTLVRTWTATDACGNAEAFSQNVSVQDTTAPQIRMEGGPDAFICDGPATVMIEAADNCGAIADATTDISADFPERVVLEQIGPGTFRLTLLGNVTAQVVSSATDDCGNTRDESFVVTAQCGSQACSPGFWRNHLEMWCATPFNPLPDYCRPGPATLFVEAFGITDFSSSEIPATFDPDMTLLQAFDSSGGSFNQTLFQGSAALLNALNPDVDFPLTAGSVKRTMRDAFAGVITFEEARALFATGIAAEGECGCPFSGGLPTTYECLGDVQPEPCPTDLDFDADMDLDDLTILLREFGCTANCTADIDGDADVDLDDLTMLLQEFGNTCP